eukprot:CAMPEP_0179099240 /NCGR_PEP_ID=MMETSP0796-20121207/45775_1 /TAXON_ID=73915 /ORGANISM="Pyrodinium bahamense, Strain pbaha01" /LENGTH=68 /DNA_ID=CAMNT_0020797039 /DNA_START=405 /DNA_END=611 /DNA_ORIENTATION=-
MDCHTCRHIVHELEAWPPEHAEDLITKKEEDTHGDLAGTYGTDGILHVSRRREWAAFNLQSREVPHQF